jgi:hypothetical protein
MPKWFKQYLQSLTDEQANELAKWYDGVAPGSDEFIETLIDPRPALYREWNLGEV